MPKIAKDIDAVPLVSLLELSARTGAPEEVLLTRLNGGDAVRDWAGRWSVPASVARRLVEEYEAEMREHERREAEQREAEDRWRRERDEEFARIYSEELEKLRPVIMRRFEAAGVDARGLVQPFGPADVALARERALERLEAWCRKHPDPTRR